MSVTINLKIVSSNVFQFQIVSASLVRANISSFVLFRTLVNSYHTISGLRILVNPEGSPTQFSFVCCAGHVMIKLNKKITKCSIPQTYIDPPGPPWIRACLDTNLELLLFHLCWNAI